ncbi:MAG: hypothetical protein KQH59_18145 [Desulfobulbaceae bacterium]|nr:hypothetical protein [Desulfobulbaceae bacterium]
MAALHVTVRRGPADNPGPTIVLEYFKSPTFAHQVGRVAIDRSTSGLKIVAGTIANQPRPFLRPGAIIRHQDLRQGDCRGKVADFSGQISVDRDGKPSVSIGLTFRRQTP